MGTQNEEKKKKNHTKFQNVLETSVSSGLQLLKQLIILFLTQSFFTHSILHRVSINFLAIIIRIKFLGYRLDITVDINYLVTQHLIQSRIHKKKPQILLVNQPIPNSPRVLSNVDLDPSGLGVHSAGQSQSAYPGLLITEISSRINICSNSG